MLFLTFNTLDLFNVKLLYRQVLLNADRWLRETKNSFQGEESILTICIGATSNLLAANTAVQSVSSIFFKFKLVKAARYHVNFDHF
jgi:hypothetical protein